MDELHKRPRTLQNQLDWQQLTTLAEVAVSNESTSLLNLVFREVGTPLAEYIDSPTLEDALATFAAGRYFYYGSRQKNWWLPLEIENAVRKKYPARDVFDICASIRGAVSLGIIRLTPIIHSEIDRIIRSVVPSIMNLNGRTLAAYALALAEKGEHEEAGLAYLQLARGLQLRQDETQSTNNEVMLLGQVYHSAASEFLLAGNREKVELCMEGIFHRANAYRNAGQPYQAALISSHLVDRQ